jgi:hypothetical protein
VSSGITEAAIFCDGFPVFSGQFLCPLLRRTNALETIAKVDEGDKVLIFIVEERE